MNTIRKTDHCKLCDHHKKDFNVGVYCGLTDNKPGFDLTCIKADYNSVIQQELFELNNHDLFLKRNQTESYVIIIGAISLGICFIIADVLFYNDYFIDYFKSSTVGLKGLFTILIGLFAIGLYFLRIGFNKLSYMLQEKRVIALKLWKVKTILKKYGMRYEVRPHKDSSFFEHGVFVKNIELKRTTTG